MDTMFHTETVQTWPAVTTLQTISTWWKMKTIRIPWTLVEYSSLSVSSGLEHHIGNVSLSCLALEIFVYSLRTLEKGRQAPCNAIRELTVGHAQQRSGRLAETGTFTNRPWLITSRHTQTSLLP